MPKVELNKANIGDPLELAPGLGTLLVLALTQYLQSFADRSLSCTGL